MMKIRQTNKLKSKLMSKIKQRRLTTILLSRPAKIRQQSIEDYMEWVTMIDEPSRWLNILYDNLRLHKDTPDRDKAYIRNALSLLRESWNKELQDETNTI